MLEHLPGWAKHLRASAGCAINEGISKACAARSSARAGCTGHDVTLNKHCCLICAVYVARDSEGAWEADCSARSWLESPPTELVRGGGETELCASAPGRVRPAPLTRRHAQSHTRTSGSLRLQAAGWFLSRSSWISQMHSLRRPQTFPTCAP